MTTKDTSELEWFDREKRQELDQYKDKYRKTLKEWKKFVNGRDDIDEHIIPAEVLNAWIRSRDCGVDPHKLPQKVILKGPALNELLIRNKAFIDISRPFLRNLYQFLKGSGFHVVLFDRQGYLLEIMGDHDMADVMRSTGGVVGALWDERSAGHNATGAIIHLKKPVQLFGSQHYIKGYHGETGCGAPIFSPEGEMLGGISLSGRNFRVNSHTLGMAVAAAHAVENDLRTRKAFDEVQSAHRYQQAVIASIMEAMIAIDNEGMISLINDPARKLFAPFRLNPQGQLLSTVLARKNAILLQLVEDNDEVTDQEVRIFTRGAWNDFIVTLTPILSNENKVIGKIIVFNEIKRAKTMVNKIVGASAVYHFEDICGRNARFMITVEQAKIMAQNDSNVLLLGKSGTGKDIFAQSIHNASRRRQGPYVAINCGAIPRDLLASELFGHEHGAFTGARRGGHQDKFELADGGTIFLDEIAELPLELQSVLLRVIEDKLVTRIGGKQTRKIDVRVITATNKDLREEIGKGNFREDLFYRINVFSISMVPLCDRPDDIPLLTRWFINKYEEKLGKRIRHVAPRIIEAFLNYTWPGNVRELQNVVERMMNFCGADAFTKDLIPEEISNADAVIPPPEDLESPVEKEKQLITRMLEMQFKKGQIAERLNISRTTLYRKIKRYGIQSR